MRKSCKNCQQDFTIDQDDLNYYDRIKVPLPTFCPNCRYMRRMSWRNAWHLFKKKDARTGEEIFSLYPKESPVKIYDKEYWISDAWDPMDYGRDYDFSRPFFEQFKELMHAVPFPAHSYFNITNCRFCTNINNSKNCYFVRGAGFTEDSSYLIWDKGSKQCFDSHMTTRCELSYGNVNTTNCYKTFFSVDCDDCTDIILSKDCVGCNNCVGCVGLRSKSYCIFNEQYSKEEYFKKVQELNLGSYQSLRNVRAKAYAFWLTKPHKFFHGIQNVNVSGDYIYESKNVQQSYRVQGLEDSKYCQNALTGPAKDCYDYSNFGQNAELIYESLVIGEGASNIKFSTQIFQNVKNIEYSIYCHNSSDLFGCISLRNKQYCIFNKQYSPSEYADQVLKIKAQMTKAGEYGEFFPGDMSPFPYQISEACEFFPLSDEEAKQKGFASYPIKKQSYQATFFAGQIPDDVKDVPDSIINEVIECAHGANCDQECTGAFRVVKDEVDFCKRMHIPLPRLCPNCRLYELFKLRNRPVFYHRQCAKCGKDIETSYAPDRPEIVYCESCYQKEVV